MLKFPEDYPAEYHPAEYLALPPDPNRPNESAVSTRVPRPRSLVALIHQERWLVYASKIHRIIQKRFDPVAPQYWEREVAIGKCSTRLSQLRIDGQQYINNALDILRYYFRDTNVIGSSPADLTTAVLNEASLHMFQRHSLLAREDYAKGQYQFHRFLKNVLSFEVGLGLSWCPVVQLFLPSFKLRPTHIFPCWVGKYDTNLIFGNDATEQIPEIGKVPEIFSTANGLVLHESVTIALLNLWIIIVPAGPPGSERWKTRVVKKEILDRYMGVYQRKWQTIDNQELRFHSYRPAARYLYWHYVTARLHASAGQPADFWTNLMGDDCWPHP